MHHMWRRSLSKDLALMNKGNGEEQVRSRSHDDMKWIISFVDQGWCLCSINIGGDEMECARQMYMCRHFISSVKGCVEKCMTGFKIDGRTIKRGKLICISVI
jgi:hypothetical protein